MEDTPRENVNQYEKSRAFSEYGQRGDKSIFAIGIVSPWVAVVKSPSKDRLRPCADGTIEGSVNRMPMLTLR